MIYDVIIIGGGAAGLWAGAVLPPTHTGLILEKGKGPGKKLLMSGKGQCNLTHDGSIKDFLTHYGAQGRRLRSILYPLSNQAVLSFFKSHGVPLIIREDGKIFPESLDSHSILNLLLKLCNENRVSLQYCCKATSISYEPGSTEAQRRFQIHTSGKTYFCHNVIVTTGGCSYPSTGSDGQFFQVLEALNIPLTPRKPALVPIAVSGYPYGELSGISFPGAQLEIRDKDNKKIACRTDDLLLTYDGFSGPLILNTSRYAKQGGQILINYLSDCTTETFASHLKQQSSGNQKTMVTMLLESTALPKRFAEIIAQRACIPPGQKLSQCSGKQLQQVSQFLTADRYVISGLGSIQKSMVTAGGVDLDHVNLKTMESKVLPGLYFAGEVLDVDGDTGGYNLQFAFSSSDLAVKSLTL